MRTSESIDSISAAFAAARPKIGTIKKDKKANVGKYGYTYASLAQVVEYITQPLGDNGLCVVQSILQDGGAVTVTTRLLHSSGQWIEGDCTMPIGSGGAQAVGSAITYGRRYGLSALLGIVCDDDDDGEAAHAGGQRQQKKQPPKTLADVVDSPAAQFMAQLRGCSTMKELDALIGDVPKDKMTQAEIGQARLVYAEAKGKVAAASLGGDVVGSGVPK